MQEANPGRTRFECANPILRVADMAQSVRYSVDVLGSDRRKDVPFRGRR